MTETTNETPTIASLEARLMEIADLLRCSANLDADDRRELQAELLDLGAELRARRKAADGE